MNFFRGLDLTLTCGITLDEAVDTSVTVGGMWYQNGTELVDGTDFGRITVVNPAMTSPPYQTTVRFNLLNNDTDAGTYQCRATVNPADGAYVTGTISIVSRNISILGMITVY